MGEQLSPIRIETPRLLLEHHYELGLYCKPCDRWTVADLQQLPCPAGDMLCSAGIT